MDPKACLQLAAEQLADGDREGLAESLENYFRWRIGGGFQPTWKHTEMDGIPSQVVIGDAAAFFLLHALAGGNNG